MSLSLCGAILVEVRLEQYFVICLLVSCFELLGGEGGALGKVVPF